MSWLLFVSAAPGWMDGRPRRSDFHAQKRANPRRCQLITVSGFVARAERGVYRCAPAHVFDFEQIVEGHRLMDSSAALGTIVVRAPND